MRMGEMGVFLFGNPAIFHWIRVFANPPDLHTSRVKSETRASIIK